MKNIEHKILLVNDSRLEITLLDSLLAGHDFRVASTLSPLCALEMLAYDEYSCVITDYLMPAVSGIDLCRRIKSNPKTQWIPVILLLAKDETQQLVHLLKSGIDDYIEKGTARPLFIEKIKSVLKKYEILTENTRLIKNREELFSLITLDLQGPVSFIESTMRLLQENFSEKMPAEMMNFIGKSRERASYSLSVINNILGLGIGDSGVKMNLSKINVGEKIKDILKKFSTTFVVNIPDGTVVSFDDDKFQQLIGILISHMLVGTNHEGVITISSDILSAGDLDDFSSALKLEFQNSNEDILIPELNFITDAELAKCREICRLHGGDIWCEKFVDSGCTFKLLIPGVVNDTATILLADDSLALRAVVRAEVERSGLQVEEVESGERVLQFVEQFNTDLLLIDVDMPVKDGVVTVKELREKYSKEKLPVVFLTTYTNSMVINKLLEMAQDVICKPLTSGDVTNKIVPLLSRSRSKFLHTFLFLGLDNSNFLQAQKYYQQQGIGAILAQNFYEAKFFTRTRNIDLLVISLVHLDVRIFELVRDMFNKRPPKMVVAIVGDGLDRKLLASFEVDHILPISALQNDHFAWDEILRFFQRQDVISQEKKNPKILLVDDSEDTVLLIKNYLNHFPCELTTAENGELFLELVKRDSFDLIFLDMLMPVKDGHEAVKEFREFENVNHLQRTPVVALTAHNTPSEIEHALHSGCDQHLSKPVYREEIIKVLKDYLERNVVV
ncbi:MAG: response regulator [Oligoflexia bacterium]|nr:response regulator [Oligoflexia bacterium]